MGYECIGEENLTHSLFGGTETLVPHKKYLISLSDFFDKYRCCIEVLDQEKICSDIPKIPYGSFLNEIKKHRIFLSDLNKSIELLYEFSPNEIHGLIGADIAGKLYTGEMKQLDCGLVVMQTRLGWTLMGKTDKNETSDSTNSVMSLHVNDAKISDLWRLDTLGILDPGERGNRQELEIAAEEHFNANIKIDAEGRYEVNLPWIQNHPPLPTCREIAERRLKSCVDSLKKNKILEEYETVFKEWIQEGIIEEVENSINEEGEHYMPHRAVIKETSTTRVRPVFDGSARQKNSPSINDCLEKGPNTVELIPAILNRFRLKKLGVTADIRRAFLQISLNERDRPFLKFLWWEEGDPAKLKIMQHKRVVFGLTCSPYLLGATLRYHLKNVPVKFKETATKLLESFYVDNCVTSVDNYEELEKFVEESKEILRNAKFELRGWEYNQTKPESKYLLPPEEKKVPVLGLTWKLKNDTLTIDLRNVFEDGTPVTKRTILSAAHKIFDPIGFTCPVTLGPKVLLQECWKLRVSWDAELPQSITKKFGKWRKEISKLKEIEIPRCLSHTYEVRGWWERLIGIIKGILRKVLGRSSLNLEEMYTVICDTESIVNQRPLTYVSEDIYDLTPLTPAMFLHDIRESGIPDLDKLDSSSINKRCVYRQRIKQDLRKRFRSEYLGYLRQSSKFGKNNRPIEVGDIVLVSSENTKNLQWPLAKVIEVYPSKDGHIRLVKVKMKGGEFLRPVLRLIPLEVNHENDIRPPSATRTSTSPLETVQTNHRDYPIDPVPYELIVPLPDKDSTPVTVPTKPIIRSSTKNCVLETESTEPNFQKTVYDSSVETVPEKRSRYGRLLKPKRKFEFH